MMKFLPSFLLACLVALTFSGCDIVEDPVCSDCLQASAGKKVLIEDFTGHTCGNCPRAHEQLEQLAGSYGVDLVIISVHAGGFAAVRNSQGYTADYTTDFGDELELFYQADLEGLPIGMVNRRQWDDGEVLQKFANWSTQVSTILQETPVVDLVVNTQVADGSPEAEITLEMNYLAETNADHNYVVLITEDSIVSKQSDYSLDEGYISAYEHEHMLRGAVTSGGIWGQQVKAGTKFAGESIERTLTMTVDPEWDLQHCHVVAFVLNGNADPLKREIIQVEEVKLLP